MARPEVAAERDQEIGAELRRIRQSKEKTVTEVAAAIGVSRRRLTDLEAGRLPATFHEIERIGEHLGVALAELLIVKRRPLIQRPQPPVQPGGVTTMQLLTGQDEPRPQPDIPPPTNAGRPQLIEVVVRLELTHSGYEVVEVGAAAFEQEQ